MIAKRHTAEVTNDMINNVTHSVTGSVTENVIENVIENVLNNFRQREGFKAEVFALRSKNTTVEAKGGAVDALERAGTSGYSIRVLSGKRQGVSFSTDFDDWKNTLESAIETSRWVEPDEYHTIAAGGTYSDMDIYDEESVNTPQSEIIDMAMEVERAALTYDPRVKSVRKASCGFSSHEFFLANTEGFSGRYASTSCSASAQVMAEDGSGSQMGWSYDGGRFKRTLSPATIGAEASRRAVELLGSVKIKPVKSRVILDNSIACEFLSLIASSISSENVLKGKSLLKDKVGLKIVSDKINIIDDALMPGRLGSRPFDGDGTPSMKNTVISEGLLKGFLYNLYTAKKGHGETTASSARGGLGSLPAVGISNLYVEPSRMAKPTPVERLIEEMGTGLLITDAMGVHMANRISGDFSIGVSGLWLEGGQVARSVKEAVLSGNLLELFAKVESVGNDLKFYGRVGSPSLLIGEVDISA
ncbi:MAG: TldD/PmbA family protein [Nitrospirae bacterium]|nr:TldD/PmbA family protein [Nitrospirota bacterium]